MTQPDCRVGTNGRGRLPTLWVALFALVLLWTIPSAHAQSTQSCTNESGAVSDTLGSLGNVPVEGRDVTWAAVDQWNNEIIAAQQKVFKETGVLVPANRIKAHIMMESEGVANAKPASAHGATCPDDVHGTNPLMSFGLMQVSTCAWQQELREIALKQLHGQTDELYTPSVNLYWGTKELAVRCKAQPAMTWSDISQQFFGTNVCDANSGECSGSYKSKIDSWVALLGGAQYKQTITSTAVTSGSPMGMLDSISVMTFERCTPSEPVDGDWDETGGEAATQGDGSISGGSESDTAAPDMPSLPTDKTFTEACEVTLTTDDDRVKAVKITPFLGLGTFISGGGEPDPKVAEGVEAMRIQAKENQECNWCYPYRWAGHGSFVNPPERKCPYVGAGSGDFETYINATNPERSGFDCSGLVHWGYVTAAGIPESNVGAGTSGQFAITKNQIDCTYEELIDANQTCWVTGDLILTNINDGTGDDHVQIYLGWNPDENCPMVVESTCVSDPGCPVPPGPGNIDQACGAQEHCLRPGWADPPRFQPNNGRRIFPALGGATGGAGTGDEEFIIGRYVKSILSGEVIAWERGTLSMYVDLNGKQCVMHYAGLDPIIQLFPGTKVYKGQRIGAVKADDTKNNQSSVDIYLSCDGNKTCINPMSITGGSNTTFCRKAKAIDLTAKLEENAHNSDISAHYIFERNAAGRIVKQAALCSKYGVIGSQPRRTNNPLDCTMRALRTDVMVPLIDAEWLYKEIRPSKTKTSPLERGATTPLDPDNYRRRLRELQSGDE